MMRIELSFKDITRLKFVWHSWAAPRAGVTTLNDFYPGDDYVDWVGISIFQQVFPWPSHWGEGVDWGGTLRHIDEVLIFASQHNKVNDDYYFITVFSIVNEKIITP